MDITRKEKMIKRIKKIMETSLNGGWKTLRREKLTIKTSIKKLCCLIVPKFEVKSSSHLELRTYG